MKITRDNYEAARKITRKYVTDMLAEQYGMYNTLDTDTDTFEHIVNTGISVLETKFPIGLWEGGGFVKAVCNNDLQGAFANADSINQKYMKFYVVLIANFSPNHLPYDKL